jgi:hypothetical protein
MRFRTKREAEQAANDAEAKVRAGATVDPAAGRVTFGDYANLWYQRQDLAASTMQNYRRRLEEHLLPTFEDRQLLAISRDSVAAWERAERKAGYADGSLRSWRALLHLILADAVEDGLIAVNPPSGGVGAGAPAGPRIGRRRRPSPRPSGSC